MAVTDIYGVRRLIHHYNAHPVLDIPELSIPQASIVGLMGPNGSGKSTLLKLLGFITAPTQGEILYKGKPEAPFSEAIRSQVTLLPQTPYLMTRSVFKNVVYGLRLRNEKNNIQKQVNGALEMVGLDPSEFAQRQWHELSGGEMQRVALAARLALKPAVLLLDEPTASVDAASIQLIKEASLQARREWGTTLIIASHDLQWMHEVCDTVFHLFKGRIFGAGHANLIFGPWQRRRDNLWEKVRHDSQEILVSTPPHKDAVAILKAESILINTSAEQPENRLVRLFGTVTRLTLETVGGRIVAVIRVGNLSLTVLVSETAVTESGLYPGRDTAIYYDPLSILWV
jgi:tungstate transport system ATP-binding protein